MADRPGGEPTEQPTPRRLQKAKEQGQVAKSRDLSGAVVYWAVVGVLAGLIGWMGGQILLVGRTLFSRAAVPANPKAMLGWSATQMLLVVGPVLGAALAASLAVGAAQARGILTLAPLKPKLSNLDPIKGLGRMFGKQALFNFLKTLLVFTLAAVLVYWVLSDLAAVILRLVGTGPGRLAQVLWVLAKGLLFKMGLLFVVVGLADYAYQRHRHIKGLMMTKYEVKKESKEQEGDPQHKAKRMQFHQEILQEAMMQAVVDSDFVVTNPTRLAVAMRYDESRDRAPVVVAKGQNLTAERIRQIARRAGVPIYRDVAVARALWELEVDQEIPERLYEAVAAILRMLREEEEAG